MDDCNIFETLGQVSSGDAGTIFRDFLRGSVRQMICEVMAAEVNELCGPRHHPGEGDHYRAGTSPGRVLVDGKREELVRPRVRRVNDSGVSHEVPLATYQAACDPEHLTASIVQALASGVSTREIKNVKPNSPEPVSRMCPDTGKRLVTYSSNNYEARIYRVKTGLS